MTVGFRIGESAFQLAGPEKRVYHLSSDHPRPGNYMAVGWVKSNPKTQQVTFLIESMEPLEDDFESFRVFIWSLKRHRYETAYIERNLKGYSPVLLKNVDLSSSARSTIATARFRLYAPRREGLEEGGDERAARAVFGKLGRVPVDSSQDATEESETFVVLSPQNPQRIVKSNFS